MLLRVCYSVDFNIRVKVISKLLLIRNIVNIGITTLVSNHLYIPFPYPTNGGSDEKMQ